MAISVHEMLDFLDTHPVRNHEGNATTLMNMLHQLYREYNTLQPICCEAGKLQGEELAFAQGIMVGMHLMTELNTLP